MPWSKALYRKTVTYCFGKNRQVFRNTRNDYHARNAYHSTRSTGWSLSSVFRRQIHIASRKSFSHRFVDWQLAPAAVGKVTNSKQPPFLDSWKRWRLYQSTSKSKPCLFCKPAVFVTLGNHKGQVFATWMGITLLVGNTARAEESQNGRSILETGHTGMALSHTDMQLKKTSFVKKTVEGVCLFFRGIYLVVLFTPALILAIFADGRDGRLRTTWLNVLLRTLEYAGPAFIKWGQWAATRPDMFPVDVCEQLSKLHSQAPAHGFKESRRIIEKAFRLPLDQLFEEFSEKPIASGSIAQVHRAVLKTKGQKQPLVVAVKVRHPRVSKVIERDFVIMNWVAKLSTKIPAFEHLQLDKTVQQFASFMTKQVDLTLEAAHLMRFIYNFRQWKNVSYPRPVYPFVHPEVLVETFEEGRSIQDFIDEGPRSRLHTQLARLGSSMLLKMLLSDNFIHGDLHPGNMFVKLGGKLPQLVILDAGMTAELSQRNRTILLELFKALSDRDGAKVARCALDFSEEQTCTDAEAFVKDVDNIFKGYLAVRGTSKMGDYISELFEQVRRYRVNLDGEVCTVMVTVVILEGWQRKLDMSLDIMRMVKELLFQAEWTATFQYVMGAIAAP